jgi:hypothetical protein
MLIACHVINGARLMLHTEVQGLRPLEWTPSTFQLRTPPWNECADCRLRLLCDRSSR